MGVDLKIFSIIWATGKWVAYGYRDMKINSVKRGQYIGY